MARTPRGRLIDPGEVCVYHCVRQDLVAQDRLGVFLVLLPTDDRFDDFALQKRVDVLTVRDVVVVLRTLPVRPTGRHDLVRVSQGLLDGLRGVVLWLDGELDGFLLAVCFDLHTERDGYTGPRR